MTLPSAAIENGGGVNRHHSGQCRLFSHQLWLTVKELRGERAGRCGGVRLLSLPRIRILCSRENGNGLLRSKSHHKLLYL